MARRNEPSPNRMKCERHSLFTERTQRSAKALGRQSQALHTSGCQRLSEIRAELGIAVVQYIAMAAQISGFLVHCVAGHLCHPLLCGMTRDARQAYAPCLQMQEEQNVVRHQAPPRQHRDGEEIGSGEHVQVPADEFLPSTSRCRRMNSFQARHPLRGAMERGTVHEAAS